MLLKNPSHASDEARKGIHHGFEISQKEIHVSNFISNWIASSVTEAEP